MLYDKLGAQLQNSREGKHLADEIRKLKAGSPGSTAFAFNATDIDGNPLSLVNFVGSTYCWIFGPIGVCPAVRVIHI